MSDDTTCDISAFIKSLQEEVKPRAVAAGIAAADRAGEHILGQAHKLAPVDTGALKASATAMPAVINMDDTITKRIGFTVDYAAAVHERLDAHHAAPTQAKFLEVPVRQGEKKFRQYVIEAMKKAF